MSSTDSTATISSMAAVADDIVSGGAGNDFLSGGAGSDQFMFDTKLNKKTNEEVAKPELMTAS